MDAGNNLKQIKGSSSSHQNSAASCFMCGRALKENEEAPALCGRKSCEENFQIAAVSHTWNWLLSGRLSPIGLKALYECETRPDEHLSPEVRKYLDVGK